MKKAGLTTAALAAAAYLQTVGGLFAGEPQAEVPPPPTGGQSDAAAADGSPPLAPSSQPAETEKTLRAKARALAVKLSPERVKRDREFQKASGQFPDFCKHWEQNLRERERDNLAKLVFILKDGLHTGTYTGYGEVKTCEAHQSKDGFSIGVVKYEEFIYSMEGKTPEEASKAEKTTITNTHTTEIFRWEKDKWFR
jgi:hypothetical protein